MDNEKLFYFDHPTHHAQPDYDMLGYTDYAEAIYQQIYKMKPNNIGITFGILGEWGMGKTTVLNMLAEKLEKEDKNSFLVIRFDAWQYLHQEELWLALMRKVVYEIQGGKSLLPKWFLVRWRIWLQRVVTNPKLLDTLTGYVIKVLGIFSLIILTILSWGILLENKDLFSSFEIKQLTIGPITIDSINQGVVLYSGILIFIAFLYILRLLLFGKLELNLPPLTKRSIDQGQTIAIDDFKDDFAAVIKSLGKKKTVVVLIDDLDRCQPDQIVPVLEAVKHLGFDGSYFKKGYPMTKIAFVLALDPVAVEHALSGYFKDYFQGEDKENDAHQFAKNYIGKIIQVPVLLPPLTESQLDQMLSGIMEQRKG